MQLRGLTVEQLAVRTFEVGRDGEADELPVFPWNLGLFGREPFEDGPLVTEILPLRCSKRPGTVPSDSSMSISVSSRDSDGDVDAMVVSVADRPPRSTGRRAPTLL